jgi:teichuronic acid biosynthesis glycosyltransferase TuaC
MMRVAKLHPITIISPQPWSPIDWIIRLIVKTRYRPLAKQPNTVEDGVKVFRPRFLSLPSVARFTDGYSMAFATWLCIKRNRLSASFDRIDSHFAYPEGFAAHTLAKHYKVPYTITLRGARDTDTEGTNREGMLRRAISDATAVIGVSDALRKFAIRMGCPSERAITIENGVDTDKFYPEERAAARTRLGIATDAQVLISVGNLIPLKGHHRIIDTIPELLKKFPKLQLLVVGGSTAFDDMTSHLETQISTLGLSSSVKMCGRIAPDELRWYLSAADVFVLATENEGWANALMEALACGLPIVTTDVGGNAEIIHRSEMGRIVPYWNPIVFQASVTDLLQDSTGREERLRFARNSSWDATAKRVIATWMKA